MRFTQRALLISLVASGCSEESPGGSTQFGTPNFVTPVPAAVEAGASSAFTWFDNPQVVAGTAPARVGLLAMNYQLRGVGVDRLGGLTTLGDVFNGDRAEFFLERFSSSGARSWSRHGLCNRALGALALYVDQSGQSLFTADFAAGCNWEGSMIDSTENPLPVGSPFSDDPSATPAVGPSDDVLVFAHSDHGTSRGFAQLSGAGRQSGRALFIPPLSWGRVDEDAGEGATSPPPRSTLQVGMLLEFEAKLAVGEDNFTSSRGGAGADSLFARVQAAPLGSDAVSSTSLPLQFDHTLQLQGASIERMVARAEDVLLAGTGALPLATASAPADDAVSAEVEYGWLATLSAEGEVTPFQRWLPAVAPRALAVAPDGSTYAAFDRTGLQFGDTEESEPDAGAVPTEVTTTPGYAVVRFDTEGAVEWQHSFPTQLVHGVYLAATDTALAVWGSHLGSVGIDGIIAPSEQGDTANALLMTLNPDGSVFSVQHWGSLEGSDGALLPVPHPAGGFVGILNLTSRDIVRDVAPGSYLLWVPN